ncbi:MAG: Oxidoreductase family, C-terminal alpha/beta domain, partial [Bacteroidota bacterium]
GVIAGRFAGQTLHYDKERSLFKESEANVYLTGEYRAF